MPNTRMSIARRRILDILHMEQQTIPILRKHSRYRQEPIPTNDEKKRQRRG